KWCCDRCIPSCQTTLASDVTALLLIPSAGWEAVAVASRAGEGEGASEPMVWVCVQPPGPVLFVSTRIGLDDGSNCTRSRCAGPAERGRRLPLASEAPLPVITIQEFQQRYKLIRPLSDQGAHSFLATGRHGQAVMVHVLAVGTPAQRKALAERVVVVRSSGTDRILDVLEVEGLTAVVTRFMLDFTSFQAWIDEVAPAGTASPTGTAAGGEFTRLFRATGDAREAPPTLTSLPDPVPLAGGGAAPATPAGQLTALLGPMEAPAEA